MRVGPVCLLRLAGALALLLPALAPAMCQEASPPTPQAWEQWQPETDRSDPRLEAPVSVWERDIELKQLLARFSETCSVQLAAKEGLLPLHLTVFAEHGTLDGLMVALARLFDGYWEFRRDQAPADRTYLLVTFRSLLPLFDEWMSRFFQSATGKTVGQRGEDLRARLALCQRARALAPEEVLQRYEETDPMLCAEVLDPATAPMLAWLSDLREAEMQQLLQSGLVERPMRDLDPSLRSHLAAWSKEVRSGPNTDVSYARQSGERPAFASEEERWQHAVAKLRWNGWDVQLHLVIPEDRTCEATILTVSDTPPGNARRRLIALGYSEETPERLAAITREEEAWREAHPERDPFAAAEAAVADSGIDPETYPFPPNRADPRLAAKLDLVSLQSEQLAVPDLLEQAARQCLLAVVASYLPPSCAVPRSNVEGHELTLGDVLLDIRGMNSDWSWNFYGQYLVATDPASRLSEEGVPMGLEATLLWFEKRYPVAGYLISDMVGAAAAAAMAAGH